MPHTPKPDMHFQRLASNRYADIVQLREELEDYKLSDKLGSEREKEMREELDLLRTQVRDLRLQRDEETKRLDYLDSLTKRTHEMRKKEYPMNSDMHFANHVSLYLRNEYGHVVKEGYGSVREAIDMAMGE